MTPFGSSKGLKLVVVPVVMAIGIALFLDQVFQHLILPNRPEISNSLKVERLLYEDHPEEIPVFGSSKGRSSFIPDSLGENVFNYSMEKCNFDVIFFLLEVELAKDKDTPIIIEFNTRSFVHRPAHTIDLSTFVPVIDDERVSDYLRENGRLDPFQSLPGIRYFGSYIRYLRSMTREFTSKKIINRGGLFIDYYPGDELLERFTGSRYKMIERRNYLEEKEASGVPLTYMEVQTLDHLRVSLDFDENKERIAKFEEMVKENRGRDFIMGFTPHHPSELAGVRNLDKLDSLFNHWNSEIPNLHALDYSDFYLPDSCFKNSSHINLTGARLFCSALKKDLEPLMD
jgi:hypothetical protein